MKKRVLFAMMAVLLAFAMLGLAGCKNEDDGDDDVQTVLKVTGIPAGVTVTVAALITDEGLTNKTPTYIGLGLDGKGVFALSAYPSFTTWYGTGEFYITLSQNADEKDPGDTYIYMPDPQTSEGKPSKFPFTNGVNTIAWGKFQKAQ